MPATQLYLQIQWDERLRSRISRFSFIRRNRAEPPCLRDWSSGDIGEVREGAGGGPSVLSHNFSCRVSFFWLIAASSGPSGGDQLKKTPPASTYNWLSHSVLLLLSHAVRLIHFLLRTHVSGRHSHSTTRRFGVLCSIKKQAARIGSSWQLGKVSA